MERLDCLSSSPRFARPEYYGKRRYSLGRMDGGSCNICRAGRAGHQQAIRFIPEMRMTVGVVYVLDNFGRIEQDHDVVCENTDSVSAELFFRKQDRTGFRHAQRRAHDRHIYTAGVRPASEISRLFVLGFPPILKYVLKLVLKTLLQNLASAQPGFLLRLEYPR